jgi:hypothetical protein
VGQENGKTHSLALRATKRAPSLYTELKISPDQPPISHQRFHIASWEKFEFRRYLACHAEFWHDKQRK